MLSLNKYNDVMVKQPGRTRPGRMDKRQAMEEVIKMSDEGRWGDLTTGICEALGIGFESFLKYSQAQDQTRIRALKALAEQYYNTLLNLDIAKKK